MMMVWLLSHVQLIATPWTIACQVPLSMGFSRQEYWSGLPFPSQGIFPTQESNLGLLNCMQILYQLNYERSPGKKKKKKIAQLCPIIFNPTEYVSPWSSPGQDTGVGCFSPFPADFLNPGIKPASPIFHADSLPNELWISPGQYTGVCSLSLLQGIFPTQGSNPSPPYCRWILYLLSYQGSPNNI